MDERRDDKDGSELLASIEEARRDATLFEPSAYGNRARIRRVLDRHVFDRFGNAVGDADGDDAAAVAHRPIAGRLLAAASALERDLDAADEVLLTTIRADVRERRCVRRALRDRLLHCAGVAYSADDWLNGERYDVLDDLATDLFLDDPLPPSAAALTAEMVPYQRTPTRVVLALANLLAPTRGIVYDLGAGVGEVAILIHLLSGLPTKAVELDPAYCAYAQRLTTGFALRDVTIINADARDVDLTDGSTFFLYTPFTGDVLAAVLRHIRAAATHHPVTVATLGPCTPRVAAEPWLQLVAAGVGGGLAMFAG